MLKPKEFTIRKLVNNRTTIKTQDGSFKGSGGEIEASITFGDDVLIEEGIKILDKTLEDLKKPIPDYSTDWLDEDNKTYRQRFEPKQELLKEAKKGDLNDSQS